MYGTSLKENPCRRIPAVRKNDPFEISGFHDKTVRLCTKISSADQKWINRRPTPGSLKCDSSALWLTNRDGGEYRLILSISPLLMSGRPPTKTTSILTNFPKTSSLSSLCIRLVTVPRLPWYYQAAQICQPARCGLWMGIMKYSDASSSI